MGKYWVGAEVRDGGGLVTLGGRGGKMSLVGKSLDKHEEGGNKAREGREQLAGGGDTVTWWAVVDQVVAGELLKQEEGLRLWVQRLDEVKG